MKHILKHTLIAICLSCLFSANTINARSFDPEASLVEIEVTKTVYDYSIPWITRNAQTRKNGILIEDNNILTTADGLAGQYLCRVRKGGIAKQYTATVKWIDHYTNIALLEVEEPEFMDGMRPTTLSKKLPQEGDLQIYRWRNGRIENRAAEIARLYVGRSKMSYVYHLNLLVSSEITGAGWSEVVVKKNKIIGLTSSASDDQLTILPATFIRSILERRKDPELSGIGHFDFRWMSAKNPAAMAFRGLPGIDHGVVITNVGSKGLGESELQAGDVLLTVDGFEIDHDGNYLDPEFGRLAYYNLATRNRFAGDTLKMTVWREGTKLEIDYTLPAADFQKDLIPDQNYEQAPEYLLAGGLLFQPLSGPLLSALGNNRPILLNYYNKYGEFPDRTGLVLITAVLPDEYTRGYEDTRYLIVDTINGQTISTLQDVQKALISPEGTFHRVQFLHDQGRKHIVIDATTMYAATERMLSHYRIPDPSRIH